jgi:thiamine biosynthesis lipoprotein
VLPAAEVGTPSTTLFEGRSMGSPLRLIVAGPGGEWAWGEVVEEFAATDVALSRFRDDAELVTLDRAAGTGVAVRVSRRLQRAVHAAERARRLTDGRFDPRILADIERLGEHGAPVASGGQPDADRRWRTTPVMHRTARGHISLERPIDLGGIGKGLALRWATARVEAGGVSAFLLEAGGDVVARGPAPEGGPWRIGVEDPLDRAPGPLAVLAATDRAVATSSIRRRRWDHDGTRMHHLVDPTTGEPAWNGLQAVTVAGPDPAWAEVWSKTLFLGGPATIAAEARGRDLAAWWVDEAGSLSMTPAARASTMWVRGES